MTEDEDWIACLEQAYDEVGDLVKIGRVTVREIAHTYATLATAVACLRHDRRAHHRLRTGKRRALKRPKVQS